MKKKRFSEEQIIKALKSNEAGVKVIVTFLLNLLPTLKLVFSIK